MFVFTLLLEVETLELECKEEQVERRKMNKKQLSAKIAANSRSIGELFLLL